MLESALAKKKVFGALKLSLTVVRLAVSCRVGDVIKDIDTVMNVSDDIMIHGKDKASHDKALHELVSLLESVGFTANLAKCEFNTSSIDFFGVNFSEAGMSPLTSRVDAFHKAYSLRSFYNRGSELKLEISNGCKLECDVLN